MSMVEEHLTVSQLDDENVYARHPKEYDGLVAKLQSVESVDGVLEAHVGNVPSAKDSKRFHIHHYCMVDDAARERANLTAHSYNAEFLLSVSEKARQKHQHIAADHGKHEEHTVRHKLSRHGADTEVYSLFFADWTTKASGSPTAKYPSIRVGVSKAKEGTSADMLEEYMKEIRSLPARFSLLGKVSIGRSKSAHIAGPQYYPESSVKDWDLGFVYSYASADDRYQLDADPEFEAIQKKWRSLLKDNHHVWDLDINRAAT